MNKKNKHGAILIGILGVSLIVLMLVYSGKGSNDVKLGSKPTEHLSEVSAVSAASDVELEAQNKELEKRISEIQKQLDSYVESEGSHGGN